MKLVQGGDAEPAPNRPRQQQETGFSGKGKPKEVPAPREGWVPVRCGYLARSRYAPSRGFTRTRSPSLMNSGT